MSEQLSLFESETSKLNLKNIVSPALLQDIPYDKIYEAARKEASRKKPAFFIHKYFARRITCNFRMMLLGALLPKGESVWDELYKSHCHGNLEDVTVLDPFMGGGTALFEAARLQTKVIGCDLQPLSKFVSEALIKEIDTAAVQKAAEEVKKSVAGEIMQYYKTACPKCKKTADIMYAFHVKTAKTESICKEHKFFSNFVLALKKDTFTLVCPKCGEVYNHNFKKNGAADCPSCGYVIASPKDGYVRQGRFHCDKCGEDKILSEYSAESGYPFSTRLIALEYYCPFCNAHGYKKAEKPDLLLYDKACARYETIKEKLPIPNQSIPVGYNTNQILNHGYQKFSDLFNKRQLLCLGLLLREINDLKDKESQFWLQLAFSGMLEMNNMFCRYQANAYKICNIFFNHAYVPITMPVENNVWGTKIGTGTFIKTIDKIFRGKSFCNHIYDIYAVKEGSEIKVSKKYSEETVQTFPSDNIESLDINKPVLRCGDSKDLSFIKANSVDIVLTDPPFGSNVMYSELIDFFHVWNYCSSIGNKLGFTEPLSPKEEEIIVNPARNKTQGYYSQGLYQVFRECNRVLKDFGLLVFSFHDKNTESWISLLKSLDNAGFYLQKAYPLHSETRTGAHTSNKNSIALDIMLICKKKTESFNIHYEPAIEEKIYQYAYQKTEEILKRLSAVEAEITEPDIENILTSQFFTACAMERVYFDDAVRLGTESLKASLSQIKDKFGIYQISDKRTGWWSEMFQEKWNMEPRVLAAKDKAKDVSNYSKISLESIRNLC